MRASEIRGDWVARYAREPVRTKTTVQGVQISEAIVDKKTGWGLKNKEGDC